MFAAIRSKCLILFLLAQTGLFLSSTTSNADDTIRIGGTGCALGSMRILASAFMKRHPHTRVVLLPSAGTSGAIKAVAKGSLDIGLLGRPLTTDEQRLALIVREYATTPFIAVIDKRYTLSNITTDDIVALYSGARREWPNGDRVRLVLRPSSDADTALIANISSDMSAAMDAAHRREGMLTALTDQDNVERLQITPGSFGFATLTQVQVEKARLNVLSFNGAAPSVDALARGSYPLAKKLYLAIAPHSSPSVISFVDFVKSPEGGAILKRTGNLPASGAGEKQAAP